MAGRKKAGVQTDAGPGAAGKRRARRYWSSQLEKLIFCMAVRS